MSEIPGSRIPSTVDHVDALPVGARLGEFEIVGLLGVGGFGMVYQAFDHSLLRFVAIKEYMPTSLAARANGRTLWVRSSSDEPSFQAGLASFVDEARLLAQFDHPSLVKVFRFWEANQTAYMVMPLYAGMTLKQARTHMRTPPTEEWLRKVIWSVCNALRVLHNGKTLHRDISPDNIFLQEKGPPVLLDLGAARFAIEDRDHKHTAVLKVNYAPIEQYADADSELKPGPWSDIYSLAAVIYGVICNDVPLPSTLRSIRDRMVPFPRVARTVRKQFGVEYSGPFVDAISKALSLQPRDRHWTVDAFLEQMGLTSAPAHLDKFDFRADLGENWIDPKAQARNDASILMGLTDSEAGSGESVDAAKEPARRNTDHLVTVLHVPGSDNKGAAPAEKPEKPEKSEKSRSSERRRQPEEAPETEFQDTVVRAMDDFQDSVMEPHDSFEKTKAIDPKGKVAELTAVAMASAQSSSASSSGASRSGSPGKSAPSPGKSRSSSKRPSAGGRPGSARKTLVLSAALLVLVGGAAAWYLATQSAPAQPPVVAQTPVVTPTPDEEIITELADPAKNAASEAALLAAAAVAASESAAAAAAAASASATTPVVAVAKEQKPKVAPVRKPVETVSHEPTPAPQPAPAPVPVAAPASQAAPSKRVNPEDACSGAGFLAKPMCVHNQCQQAGMESHPVCVESKRKREEERRQRQMYTQ
ncbi:serine/threonine protein kinase [Diaphorobacter sp. HDW4B]|uniref:serine/threonine protein kinase n=1 Tax=Diaphorobacter sp. HDW4B TaxID=2714925 RepID=UPI001409A4C3|nr:serine/threonine-protein kinase [Diaphorobacter sp. HDW4B]QIL70173.1 serine/threonine protein kinase [Diaphorobacter sp. HDW4B]